MAHDYLAKLALLLGCEVRKVHDWYVVESGTTKQPRAMALLQRPDQWLAVLADYTTVLERALATGGPTSTEGQAKVKPAGIAEERLP